MANILNIKYYNMRKILLVILSAFLMMSATSWQDQISYEDKLKEQILALDIAAWNAWKNKDVAYFKANTTETFQSGGAYGFMTKAEMITTSFVDCTVRSFSLDDVNLVIINKKTVVLTYVAMQDAVCGGEKLPSKVRAAVTYVKVGKKWLEAFYMDAPIQE
jgi:uncharacterized protein DUF4440